MDVKEAIDLKKQGKKIPNDVWKKFSNEEKKTIMEACNGRKDADGIPWKNDWRFYAINEQIAKDFGSIPYNVLAGVGALFKLLLPEDRTSDTKLTEKVLNTREMCCTTLRYWQVPGIATSKTDGVNMAATQLYTFIRRANSGARNYEAADIMMYILAMAEIYSEYFEIKRALGIAQLYQIENHNLPDTVLSAININSKDLRNNIAQYRGKLNVLCSKINALAVPAYFRMFDRIAYITTKLFADSTSIRGQFYAFNKVGYRTWSAKTSEKGSSLVATRYPTGLDGLTIQSRLTILESMIDAMFLDDDINTMSGDILKAFGQDKLYSVVPTPDDYVVMPTYDEDILAQIENSYAYTSYTNGQTLDTVSMSITQDNQLITFKPVVEFVPESSSYDMSDIVVMDTKYFNSHKDDPTFMDTIEWTRLISTAKFNPATTTTSASVSITSCGQELIEDYVNYKINEFNNVTMDFKAFNNAYIINYLDNNNAGKQLSEALSRIGQYNWHPGIYVIIGAGATPNQQWRMSVMMDLKKFAVISDTEIIPLHQSALSACLWADDLYATAQRS